MIYYKSEINGYITAIAFVDYDITVRYLDDADVSLLPCEEEEYLRIFEISKTRPHTEGKGYRLKTDLTWEEYDLPVPSEDDEIDADEALSILTGESV